jgi:hypothetical protein
MIMMIIMMMMMIETGPAIFVGSKSYMNRRTLGFYSFLLKEIVHKVIRNKPFVSNDLLTNRYGRCTRLIHNIPRAIKSIITTR